MKKIDFKQIKPSVIVRYVMQVVAIINQALAIFGKDWSGLSLLPARDLPDPGIELRSPAL